MPITRLPGLHFCHFSEFEAAGTNENPVCDILLGNNTNLYLILHCFQVILAYWPNYPKLGQTRGEPVTWCTHVIDAPTCRFGDRDELTV